MSRKGSAQPGRKGKRRETLTSQIGHVLGDPECILSSMGDATHIVQLADGTTREVSGEIWTRESREDRERKVLLSTDGRTQRANIRRSKIIELVGKGYTPEQACQEIGIAKGTYYQYRSDLPSFRTQVDLARQQWYKENEKADPSTWDSFISFRKRFFRFDTDPVQAQIVDAIENAQPMDVTLFLVPPEFGKTTLLEDKICEILAKEPLRRVAYISEGSGHSKKVAGRIKKRMTEAAHFGDYIARYGPFYEEGQERSGKPWTTNYFTIAKADHDERDYSFEARGARSNIQGSRVDDLFIDDIQSLKSLSQTEFLLGQFRQEWVSRGGQFGRVFIVGNRIALGDIYQRLIEEELINRLIEIPAVQEDEPCNCNWPQKVTLHGTSNSPQRWPDEALLKRKKQVGKETWFRTYMMKPREAGTITFTQDVIDRAKAWNRVIAKREGLATIMSLDPGLGGGNSLTICQYTSDRLEVVDQIADYGLGRTEQILERVAEMASMYRPTDFIIEMMAWQQSLGKDDRMKALSDKYGFRIYPHETRDNKYDPVFGVASMAGSMRAQELTIPWGDEHAQEQMTDLIKELETWRPAVRGIKLRMDRVMSLWFAWLWWTNMRLSMKFEETKWEMKKLPWKPTPLRKVFG
jgi:hypothetical protein